MCELQQRGTASRSWVAGRYSNNEPSVQAFDLMVADRYAGDPIVGPAHGPRPLRRVAQQARQQRPRHRERPRAPAGGRGGAPPARPQGRAPGAPQGDREGLARGRPRLEEPLDALEHALQPEPVVVQGEGEVVLRLVLADVEAAVVADPRDGGERRRRRPSSGRGSAPARATSRRRSGRSRPAPRPPRRPPAPRRRRRPPRGRTIATISRPRSPSPSTTRRLASSMRISFGPSVDRAWAICRIQRWAWYRSHDDCATARARRASRP